jgi:hypothetical protein
VAEPIPPSPAAHTGRALIAGQVTDAAGAPVAGATIRVAETDALAMSGPDGAYQIEVPSDSSVTLAVAAPGMAGTFTESVVVAAGAKVLGFDLDVLPSERINAMNGLTAPGHEGARGLMAVRLHSLAPACTLSGATVSVWPAKAGTVLYAAAGAPGTMIEPDPSLSSVQQGAEDGAQVALWLTGTQPPANDLRFTVQQAGCRLAAASPSLDGLTYSGQRHVAPGALTMAHLFLEATP